MENATKALLIAAGVLIVILLIAMSMSILNSVENSSEDVKDIGGAISQATQDAVEQSDWLTPKYKISVTTKNCTADPNNPTTITQGKSATLSFTVIASFDAGATCSWECNNLSKNCKITSYVETYNTAQSYIMTLSEPTGDIKINVKATITSCCFVAGTQVLLADGNTKNIENVKIGDKVLSYNETTKEYEEDTVTNLITKTNTTNLARITLVDGTKIEMNEYHPIYTEEGWKSLTNYNGLPTLTKENKLLSTNGEFVEILSIEQWVVEEPIFSYNLTVEKNHNYFVGNTPILAHNAGCYS